MDITNVVSKLVREHGTNNPFKIAKEKGIVILEVELGNINGYYRKCNNVKMIFINTDNSIKLVSLNKKYQDITVTDTDNFKYVGTVVF